MEISPVTYTHIPEIVELWKEFMDFHEDIEPSLKRGREGHLNFKNRVRDLLKSEDSLVLVALDKNSVIGFSIAQVERPIPAYEPEPYGLISDIAVKSCYRRKGIGK